MTAAWDPPGPSQAEARWSATLVVSLVLHVAAFGAALGLPRLLPRGSQGPAVYVVDLVSLPAGPLTATPAPAPPPAPKAAAPPPKAEKPIALPEQQAKKTPPKKAPSPKEPEKRSEPKAQEPARETAKPPQPPKTGSENAAATGAVPGAAGTRPGGAGGTGAKATDEYNFYFTLLRRKIDAAWKKPLDPTSQAVGKSATITLTLSSSGRVTRVDLTRTSGFDSLDRSVLRAVQDAEPFPPFPYQLGVDTLTVNFEFVLTP